MNIIIIIIIIINILLLIIIIIIITVIIIIITVIIGITSSLRGEKNALTSESSVDFRLGGISALH